MVMKAGMINSAQANVHKDSGGVKTPSPASRKDTSNVNNERTADMKGAIKGQPMDKNALKGAGDELRRQHPEKHDDRGPHHGGTTHVRHEPLHGLKPTGG